MKVIGSGL